MIAAPLLGSQPLRRALLFDAAASGAMGLLLVAGATPLVVLLGLSAGLLRGAGLFLIPFAAWVAVTGRRTRVSRAAGWTIVAVNVVWALDSVLLLASGWVRPTALGAAFVLAQAGVVALFACVQIHILRRRD